MTFAVEFFENPDAFLARANAWLAADPVSCGPIARSADQYAEGPADPHEHWWAVITDNDTIVAAAMRTAPWDPCPLWVTAMPEHAATLLGTLLRERGERYGGANGAMPAAQRVCEAWSGEAVSVTGQLRLHEITAVTTPPAPPGTLELATPLDLGVVSDWVMGFAAAVRAQSGGGHEHPHTATAESAAAYVTEERAWLWRDEVGVPTHLTVATPPSFGVRSIITVTTPEEYRGRGYARATVARLAQQFLDDGHRCVLFTDATNPVSNHVYASIGFEAVADMAEVF